MIFASELLLSAILGIVVPTGSPAPAVSTAAAPAPLRTIVTVKSSPFCNALAQHFNAAFVPLSGNNRNLEIVNSGLVEIDEAFSHPDYANRLQKARAAIVAANDQIAASLPGIALQIRAVREAASQTGDAKAASQTSDSAAALESAYSKERQLSIDLTNLAQAMMDANMNLGDRPLGTLDAIEMPKEMSDIKAYLRFDGRRDLIVQSESKAIDIAYDVANQKCSTP
ncbi:MAG: hypothetical protein M3R51_02190 [Candidatus Eremiobacteraeota bacterium]|nr:hypothetical protein [Candidatus Eremiobacteraeota bacterium]